jgi:aspartate kinase
MARIVMKFGGTSVADLDRIRNAAKRVKAEYDQGHEIAVAVSAMAGETNRLVDFVTDANKLHDAREYDVVVSSGEQVTRIPILTDDVHGKARILAIET